MGAFGYGPFDCDGALNWYESITKILKKEISKKSLDYETVRSIAEFIWINRNELYLWNHNGQKMLQLLISKLKKILDDKSWIDDWDDPLKIKRNIRNQIYKLEKLKE